MDQEIRPHLQLDATQAAERRAYLRVQVHALQAPITQVEENALRSTWRSASDDADLATVWKREILAAADAELQFEAWGHTKPRASNLLRLSQGFDQALLKDPDYVLFNGFLEAVRSVRVASETASPGAALPASVRTPRV